MGTSWHRTPRTGARFCYGAPSGAPRPPSGDGKKIGKPQKDFKGGGEKFWGRASADNTGIRAHTRRRRPERVQRAAPTLIDICAALGSGLVVDRRFRDLAQRVVGFLLFVEC